MNNDVYTLFLKLKKRSFSDESCYLAESMPFSKKNKIGLSRNGFPVFFIESLSDEFVADVRLELITVQFNQLCQLEENGKIYQGLYDVVFLKTENADLQKYFIDVFCLILKKLPANASPAHIKKEIQAFIKLFRMLSDTPKKEIQGLWAELFVIAKSNNPDYLLKAWHVSPSDKYDFNDGSDKLEVKSTQKMRRVHHFALEQLTPNKTSKLIIASVFVIETGIGMNLAGLRDLISKKITAKELLVKLDEIIIRTLGSSINRISDISFDYKQAEESLCFFDSKDIPTIAPEMIPPQVADVHFVVDLTNTTCLKKNSSIFRLNLFKGLLK